MSSASNPLRKIILKEKSMLTENEPARLAAGMMIIHADNGEPIRVIADEKGPNGGPVGLNGNGDQVEVLPGEQFAGEQGNVTFMLLRSVTTIAAQYDEFHEKVWWNRHQCWLDRLGRGEDTLTPERRPNFEEAQRQANRILAKHGVENLIMDDFELGFVNGQMAALAWAMGAQWNEASDT